MINRSHVIVGDCVESEEVVKAEDIKEENKKKDDNDDDKK